VVGYSIRTTIQNKHEASVIPVPDLNPKENEWAELKRRSTHMDLGIRRIWRDSVWRNGL